MLLNFSLPFLFIFSLAFKGALHGFNFYHYDPYTQNLFAKGFEYDSQFAINAVTTFETFEHFVNPLEEIEKMLSISKNIIFTTELLPQPIPKPHE